MATPHSTQDVFPDSPDSELEMDESGDIAISPEIAPDYSVPPTKLEQLKSSKWRAVAAFAGATLIGGILMPLIVAPGNSGAQTQAVSTWELSLPESSTMITELSAAPGKAIRGQVSPVADITGKAPVGGAVARWVVEPGSRVQAGQPIVQISSGAASAPALPGETRQIEAEKQQTAASDDQLALAQRLTSTQQKLVMAQQRVERAQDNIGKAREVIAGLRSGAIAQPDVPPPVPRKGKSKANPKLSAARAATRTAQASFSDTKAKLDAARSDLSSAQKALAPLQSKLDEAQANVKAIEAKFDGSLASASDVQAARSARDNAKGTLKSATSRLETAQKQIPALEKQLVTKERAADAARNAEAKLPAMVGGEEIEVEAPAPRPPSTNTVSVEEATKMVSTALAESRAATREADRLRAQVDAYQAQAQKSNQRITRATENLQQEQQRAQSRVVQSVPRVRFTAASAPASGVVVWIATLAREVGAGQSVFGMSSGKSYQARFEDRTDGWKNARVGQVVNALLAPPAPVAPATVTPPAATAPSADDAGSPPMPVLVSPGNPAGGAPAGGAAAGGVPAATPAPELTMENASELGATAVKVRLTRIAPPENAGGAAILEGELVSAGGNSAGPDYRLLASLPSVGAPDILAVPESALVERDGTWMVAVIEDGDEPQTEVTPVPDPTAEPAQAREISGQLVWRKVEVGATDGVARRVMDGLKAGERIITDPLPLIAQAPPEGATLPRVKLAAL